ncbi:MAG: hypothetical protein ACYCOU_07400 [Sulfobacillus sp.]
MSVGMPAAMKLDLFADQVFMAFGDHPYLVGSALTEKRDWHDVDVRLILDDEKWTSMGLGEHVAGWSGASEKWMSLCLAYSALGREMTGLPIDFQIQQRTQANERYKGPRDPLGLLPWRFVQ